LVARFAKTRLSEGISSEEPSPKVLATEPVDTPDLDESLEKRDLKQAEDTDEVNEEREGDIYAQKVLACKSLTA
jgi:hypothetical protein